MWSSSFGRAVVKRPCMSGLIGIVDLPLFFELCSRSALINKIQIESLSIGSGLTTQSGRVSVPDTWVTFHFGNRGSTFLSEGVSERLESACLVVEVAEIIVHESAEPDALA